ncbi:MAG: hypothetical protein K2X93_28335 [Candidatus Obscuribacterales bacterium]|nr:hypothetical protein [Candidatus Obscuribacterales bacterium]
MGSNLELNDTLLVTDEQGFPSDLLSLASHLKNPVTTEHVKDKKFAFSKKDGARIFHLDPVRIFLVENIDGKWLFWGKAYILEQTISKKLEPNGSWTPGRWETSGVFKIVDLFDPDYQRSFTKRESPPGKSYF